MRKNTVIGDVTRIHAARLPGGLAVVDGDRRVTWQELDDRVNRLGNLLRDTYGIGAGDRVAILAGNCLEYVDLTFASSRIQAIYSGLNVRHHPAEMAAQLSDCGARLLIVGRGFERVGATLAEEAGIPALSLDASGPGASYDALLAAASADPVPPHGDADAPYVLTYTSGTTGEPKGAMISSRNEIALAVSLAVASETRVDDKFMVITPLFHKGGQFSVMHPAYLGRPIVLVAQPDPALIFRTVEAERVTVFVAVPTLMKMMTDHLDDVGPAAYDLSSIRHVLYGSNPIQPGQLRHFAALLGCSLCQIGGIGTEGGIGLVLDRVDHEQGLANPELAHRLQSCGRVQPAVEMRLVDEQENDVAIGEIGEMVFRGDAYVAGYWERPEASQAAWRGGWFHSGDLGRRDADGYIYYVDRKSGRIKTGGETVYAREVEAALQDHALVQAVAVVGVPDETWGEAIWAVVELTSGQDVPEDLEHVLQEHARRRLAGYKVPKRVIVQQLPRTALGKIAVGEVRALALDLLSRPLTRPTVAAGGPA